jgi:RNA polymerase sigma factor (sigma-70 family)
MEEQNFYLSEQEFQRLQRGDERLQTKIFDKYALFFVRVAKERWQVPTEDAEEFVSSAFASLFSKIQIGSVKMTNLKGFVYGGMEFKWREFLEKQRRTIQPVTDVVPEIVPKETENFKLESLNRMFEQLCDKCRKVLTDVYWEGKKFREIALELNISEDAARQRKLECVNKLRALLGGKGSVKLAN